MLVSFNSILLSVLYLMIYMFSFVMSTLKFFNRMKIFSFIFLLKFLIWAAFCLKASAFKGDQTGILIPCCSFIINKSMTKKPMA